MSFHICIPVTPETKHTLEKYVLIMAARALPTSQSKSSYYRDNTGSVTWHFVGGKDNTRGENTFFSRPKQQITFAVLHSTVRLIHFN